MFRLSAKVKYGLRFMLDLAFHDGEGPIPLKDIAKREQISEKYLGNLVSPFKTASLVKSVRGSHGGYSLARPIDQISLSDVLQALEGPLSLVECVYDPSACKASRICIPRDIWYEITRDLQQSLDAVTLQDMVQRRRGKTSGMKIYRL